jgi:uncharacterized protein
MILFEWDDRKAAINRRKHGISFEDATQVFEDEFALAEHDRIEDDESRWRTIGMVAGVVVLLVAHTVKEEADDEIIRIISARRATRKERKRYEQNRQKDCR